MNEQANPYIAGPSVTGAAFYGRKDVFRFVNESLSTPQQRVIVLYGQRRIGKTSILRELPRHLSFDEFHCVYFDLQDRANHPLPWVLHQLAVKIAQSLSIPEPPESNTDDENYLQDHFLPSVYQVLKGKCLVLLFDEFDVLEQETLISNAASTAFFPYLQRLIAQEPQLAFIFALGRRIDELPARFQAIFKQARYMRVSLLRGQDAVELITQPARGQLTYTPEALEAILSLTAGHPYFTQATCHEIFFLMQHLGKKRVSPNDVDIIFGNAIESSTGGLSWFWDGLPQAEQLFLSAVAQIADEGGVATESAIRAVLSKYELSLLNIELRRVPGRLIEWEMLSLESGDSYRFVIELLRRWVAKEHPLQKAKQPRDLGGRAMRSYDNARTARRRGDFETAIVYYRQALAARPNHAAQKRSRMRLAIGAVAILLLGLGLSFALPALRKLLPTATLVPTELVLLPSLTPTPSLTSTSLPTPTEALATTPEATPTPTSIPPAATDTATPTTAATDTPTPTLTPTETPMPTPTPITIIVAATPAPLPIPVPFPAPRLTGPENEHKFLEGEAATIILQWEPVGPLAENEWYQVILSFFKLGEIQYAGPRIKETAWQVPEYFYGQADQPERAYYWNVTVIQVNKAPDGKETSIERSPPSETWAFYWP